MNAHLEWDEGGLYLVAGPWRVLVAEAARYVGSDPGRWVAWVSASWLDIGDDDLHPSMPTREAAVAFIVCTLGAMGAAVPQPSEVPDGQ